MVEYKTVEKQASSEFVEKKSRFIGHVKPVKSVQEAQDFINEIKMANREATHNVPAYVLLKDHLQRCSDDGEPSGTAGVPVLDVILKSEVKDVCVVVTRYFGGVLLGTGGLVRAYSHAAKIALDAGGIVTMAPCIAAEIEIDYSFYERARILLEECGANVEDCVFTDRVKMIFSARDTACKSISEKLTELSGGRYSFVKTGEKYTKI